MAKHKTKGPKNPALALLPTKLDPKQLQKNGFNFISEFKEFAFQGNVIDLAVGIIIGAAFNSLVQSLVKDMVMPIFGWLLGGTDFSNLYITLGKQSYESLAAAQAAKAPIILYGVFLNQVINFLIVAMSIFIVLKVFLKGRKAAKPTKK